MRKMIKLLNMEDRTIALAGAKMLSKMLKTKSNSELADMALLLLNSLDRNEAVKVVDIANCIVLGDVEQYRKHANL